MEVADLGEQAERSESRDAAEAGERLDRLAPRLLAGDLVELRIDGEQLGVERAEVAERVFQSGLGEGVVEALTCFRGISTLTALSLLAEVGDFHRFASARELMSFLG